MAKKVLITDTILRDAHQSQAATRMTLNQMLPALDALDEIPLVVDGEVLEIEMLLSNGEYSSVEFEASEQGEITIPVSAGVLEPIILLINTQK